MMTVASFIPADGGPVTRMNLDSATIEITRVDDSQQLPPRNVVIR